jgi:hypothetical protein
MKAKFPNNPLPCHLSDHGGEGLHGRHEQHRRRGVTLSQASTMIYAVSRYSIYHNLRVCCIKRQRYPLRKSLAKPHSPQHLKQEASRDRVECTR